MMSLDEAIKHAEYIVNNRKDAISVCWSVRECEQITAWLRELQERRKAPEIVRCGECRHRDPEDKKCDCGHDIIWQLPRDDDWYCADAERRTDGENLPE